MADLTAKMQFRDPARAKALAHALAKIVDEIGRPVSVMHVCGSHEQAIARFGLRAAFPKALTVIMGPGCPVCVTDCPEIDDATAAVVLAGVPKNFSVLSAHKYIPPAMEIVAEMPESKVEGFLAAGHAAAITGSDVFLPFVERHRLPVVVAGFEPLDVLAALVRLVELVKERRPAVENLYPRCVTAKGNGPAQEKLWKVFRLHGGRWRGIAHIPNGNLRLKDEWAHVDARRRFTIDLAALWDHAPSALAQRCVCGDIMAGLKNPTDCALYGKECTPEAPVGACMVSTEGACRIWHTYGGVPDLRGVG